MPLPSAQTESAREARRQFFCELCNKGYARSNEYDAHLSSYDHTHRQRMKDMRALTRNPTAAVRANREKQKRKEGSEMISMNLKEEKRTINKAPGFRDASGDATAATKDEGRGTVAPRGFPTELREEKRVEDERRPLEWDELERFDELVDASMLPAEMRQREPTSYVDIWADPVKKTQWCGDVYTKFMAMQTDADRETWRHAMEQDDGEDL